MFSFTGIGIAQSINATYDLPIEGYFWKDHEAIIQILDAEITTTTTELAQPNSGKNKEILIAYNSLLNHTKNLIIKETGIYEVLDMAFELMINEDSKEYQRALIKNEMKIKQQELLLKLTYK